LYISSGTVVDTAESLLSMPKDYVQADGTILFEDLHHISWDMIKDRPSFAAVAGNARSPFRQRLLSGEWVLMAHNAQFEIDRLSESMPGFRDFYRSGRLKVIDTMYMSRFLDKNGNKLTAPDWYRNDKLDSYAHRWGVLAEDEDELHRGFDDARIMWEAFEKQLAAIQNGYY
jgi:DNA polymerase III epsilon subunit-like protein